MAFRRRRRSRGRVKSRRRGSAGRRHRGRSSSGVKRLRVGFRM